MEAQADERILFVVVRPFVCASPFFLSDFPKLETCPQAYNALGQASVQERLIRLADPAVLEAYGDGWEPLRWVFDKGKLSAKRFKAVRRYP